MNPRIAQRLARHADRLYLVPQGPSTLSKAEKVAEMLAEEKASREQSNPIQVLVEQYWGWVDDTERRLREIGGRNFAASVGFGSATFALALAFSPLAPFLAKKRDSEGGVS